ncbi:hypothetical protein C8R46DRAFT_1217107 [Mycena filopes]|nr:hypothetical protein C8R46DRAFT_1217107 [Mycena filopes]
MSNMEYGSFLASGDFVAPVFSMKNHQQWISFNSTSLSIPSDAMLWIKTRSYPKNNPPKGILDVMDNQHQAGWYSSSQHWRGFNPRAELEGGADDPIAWVFNTEPIAYVDQTVSAPHPDKGQIYAGCFINDQWVERAISVATRVNRISAIAAAHSWFYTEAPGSPMGKIPEPVEIDALPRLQVSEADAFQVATATRHAIMDHLGFISWIGSMTDSWKPALSGGDRVYLESLRLSERPTRGALFQLSTDYQQSNFEHWVRHKVPFHLLWTDEEEEDGHFTRFSPRYIDAICSLRAQVDGEPVNEFELYFYEEIKGDLDRYDRFFQDRYSEHRGYVVTRFQPDYDYCIVDFLLWGSRPLQNWTKIRVYAERFKCVRTKKLNGFLVTFFRQSPLRVDEPWHLRSKPLVHPWPLEQFADAEYGLPIDETSVYMEDTVTVREMRKSQWAPGEGRTFSPYDGRRSNTGLTAQMWDEHRHRIASRADPGTPHYGSHQYIPARGEVGVSSGAEWRSPDHRPSLEERLEEYEVPEPLGARPRQGAAP